MVTYGVDTVTWTGWIQAAVGVVVGLGASIIAGVFSIHSQRRTDLARRRQVMMEYAGALHDMATTIGDVPNGDPDRTKVLIPAEERLESSRRDFNQYLLEFY